MDMSKLTTPVEIDTAIAKQSMIVAQIDSQIERQVRYRDLPRSDYLSRNFNQDELDALLAERGLESSKLESLRAQYTGWPRYYHVINNNGHIHTDMDCTSCYHDTQYNWRVDLSGLTPEQVVEREAYNACSVCMPIAPAEQRQARDYYNKQQREQRAAEREAKKDEKLRKAAERAVKFLAKVNKQVEKSFGSWDVLWAEYSLYGHDGKKSLYDATFDMPSQVGDYLYDEMAARNGDRSSRHNKDPKKIIAEANLKGLI
jgi:hypothetical protein